jgi:hypothetical protein
MRLRRFPRPLVGQVYWHSTAHRPPPSPPAWPLRKRERASPPICSGKDSQGYRASQAICSGKDSQGYRASQAIGSGNDSQGYRASQPIDSGNDSQGYRASQAIGSGKDPHGHRASQAIDSGKDPHGHRASQPIDSGNDSQGYRASQAIGSGKDSQGRFWCLQGGKAGRAHSKQGRGEGGPTQSRNAFLATGSHVLSTGKECAYGFPGSPSFMSSLALRLSCVVQHVRH